MRHFWSQDQHLKFWISKDNSYYDRNGKNECHTFENEWPKCHTFEIFSKSVEIFLKLFLEQALKSW